MHEEETEEVREPLWFRTEQLWNQFMETPSGTHVLAALMWRLRALCDKFFFYEPHYFGFTVNITLKTTNTLFSHCRTTWSYKTMYPIDNSFYHLNGYSRIKPLQLTRAALNIMYIIQSICRGQQQQLGSEIENITAKADKQPARASIFTVRRRELQLDQEVENCQILIGFGMGWSWKCVNCASLKEQIDFSRFHRPISYFAETTHAEKNKCMHKENKKSCCAHTRAHPPPPSHTHTAVEWSLQPGGT